MKDRSGFTIIEILIAIVLLTFISLGIYQATNNAFRIRNVLTTQGDFYNEIRLAMGILGKDISQIFNPKVFQPKEEKTTTPSKGSAVPKDDRQKEFDLRRKLEESVGPAANYETRHWSPMMDEVGIRHSKFLGDSETVSFLSSTNFRVYKDSKESIFTKIDYRLDDDPSEDRIEGTRMLVKVENPNAFDVSGNDEKFNRVYPLIRGVKEMKLRYYHQEKDKWHSKWDSTQSDFKEIFPDIVELSLTVLGGDRIQYEGTYRFRRETPIEGINPSF